MPAAIISTTTGTTALVAAPGAGKAIRVHGIVFITDTATVITLKSASTAITGPMTFPSNGGMVHPVDPNAALDCAENEALNLTQTIAGVIGGWVTYQIRRL